jgi:DNA-binding winged helix-turn-helix (wHTH) protein/tetratricopeptide (TPR) repeat protein
MSLPVPLSSHVIRFGVFEADLRSGELRKNGVKVKIQDLPFRALKLLLNHPNEVLSRDQFRHALWPEGVFVDFDHGISSAINRLRDALGDSADNPLFIETVDRRGYRWIAPTHISPPHIVAGPVLVKTDVKDAVTEIRVDPSPAQRKNEQNQPVSVIPSHRWGWTLIVPASLLLLALWGLRPIHRSANAAVAKSKEATELAASHRPSDAEEFYLKGRFYWGKRTPDALNKAVDYFTQAIIRDPNYAPAYVGLAECYNLLREYTLMPASDAYPRALAAARKAVELDPQSSEAHASLAFALFYGMWDAAGAEREFRRAIELNPGNAVAHHWYATYLSVIGENAKALAEIERAQALDPGSKAIVADKGDLLWLDHQSEAGVALLKQLEASEPDFISPHRYLKVTDLASGDYTGFLFEWRQEATLIHDAATLKLVDAAQKGFASGGAKGMLEVIRAGQKNLYLQGKLSPYFVAQTDSLLADKQEALQYLKLACDQHDEQVVGMRTDRLLANLENEPGYRQLIAQLHLSATNTPPEFEQTGKK